MGGHGEAGLLSSGPHGVEFPSQDTRLALPLLAFRQKVKAELFRQAFN